MFKQLLVRSLHHFYPNLLWKIYAKKCNQVGINQSLFILSFDCDTEEDIEVALEVHKKLQSINITPVYAVPGELLKKGKEVYKKIHETGAEFLNHGGRSHTYFDTKLDRYASCFFYDQQPINKLKEDIFLGHKILKEILGVTPKGWRTPHFGTFQQKKHLEFLYGMLKSLNYDFSTSTNPEQGYLNGPLCNNKYGIVEIPVTGISREPLNIMDSWCYFQAPNKVKKPGDYIKDTEQLIKFMLKRPMLINIYGDPSHIYDKVEFFQAMKLFSKNMTNINYSKLINITNENIRNI